METWLERASFAEIYGGAPIGAPLNYVYAGRVSDMKDTIIRGLKAGLATAAIIAAIGVPYMYRDNIAELIDRMRGNESSLTEQDLIDSMERQELHPSVMDVPVGEPVPEDWSKRSLFDGVEYNAISSSISGVEGNYNYVYDDQSVGAKPWSRSRKGKPTIGIGHLMTQTPEDRDLFRKLFGSGIDYDKLMDNEQDLESDQVLKLFKHDSEERIKWAIDNIPEFKNFNAKTQAAIMNAKYRGDLGPRTVARINAGDWIGAAKEYLNHGEYRSVKYRIDHNLPTNKKGIVKRMEGNAEVFRSNAN